MFNKVLSGSLHGVEGRLIAVEADVSEGLPAFNMVGFLASEVREAGDRVRTALKNSGYQFPPKKITVNLSPANIRKEGSAFDLPISIALLSAYGYIPEAYIEDILIIGELSLNGDVKGVKGILPIVDHAKNEGIRKIILPYENRKEASMIPDVEVFGVKTLNEAVDHLLGNKMIEPELFDANMLRRKDPVTIDFSDVKGQIGLKRATEIAVAGMHNILLIGPPGAGKSMIAKRIPTIMPELTYEESIELTKIYSVNGLISSEEGLIVKRPFRTPHHTITAQALLGGGLYPKPGEISLAHNGVLFLDELLEFQKNIIEMLRQPIEDRKITISRLQGNYTFPCKFMLVAAMNPCPCGYFPDRQRCRCTAPQIERYLHKLSQPMLDRMDMCLSVKRISYEELYENPDDKDMEKDNSCNEVKYSSTEMRNRIIKAINIQIERNSQTDNTNNNKNTIMFNSQISEKYLDEYCMLGSKEIELRKKAFESYDLTARGASKILKVARTIADLDGSYKVKCDHLWEALSYRINDYYTGGDGV